MTRKETFQKLWSAGNSLAEIGNLYHISRQRVHQIINSYHDGRPGRPLIPEQLDLFILKNREPSGPGYYQRKEMVLSHYGNGKPACVLCGFSDIRALSIDHINGGGAKHIKQVHNLYDWLIKQKYPDGFRTLCMNCQWVTKAQNNFVRKAKNHSVE